jgi:hypothetical protein
MVFNNYGESQVERTAAPVSEKARDKNIELMKQLLNGAKIDDGVLAAKINESNLSFPAFWCTLNPGQILEFLQKYQWEPGYQTTLQLVIEFLKGKSGNPCVKDWIMIAPQTVKSTKGTFSCGGKHFDIRLRTRSLDGSRYLVYSEPDHILMARFLVGVEPGSATNPKTQSLRSSQRAVLLFYPVGSKKELSEKIPPTMGFVLAFPRNNIKKRVQFSVRDESHPDAVVVDGPPK